MVGWVVPQYRTVLALFGIFGCNNMLFDSPSIYACDATASCESIDNLSNDRTQYMLRSPEDTP